MGEYPEEYENGKFAGAPSVWIPDVSGAKAGVMMLGRPRLGTPRYAQGSAPKIDFLDCAKVFQKNPRCRAQVGETRLPDQLGIPAHLPCATGTRWECRSIVDHDRLTRLGHPSPP